MIAGLQNVEEETIPLKELISFCTVRYLQPATWYTFGLVFGNIILFYVAKAITIPKVHTWWKS